MGANLGVRGAKGVCCVRIRDNALQCWSGKRRAARTAQHERNQASEEASLAGERASLSRNSSSWEGTIVGHSSKDSEDSKVSTTGLSPQSTPENPWNGMTCYPLGTLAPAAHPCSPERVPVQLVHTNPPYCTPERTSWPARSRPVSAYSVVTSVPSQQIGWTYAIPDRPTSGMYRADTSIDHVRHDTEAYASGAHSARCTIPTARGWTDCASGLSSAGESRRMRLPNGIPEECFTAHPRLQDSSLVKLFQAYLCIVANHLLSFPPSCCSSSPERTCISIMDTHLWPYSALAAQLEVSSSLFAKAFQFNHTTVVKTVFRRHMTIPSAEGHGGFRELASRELTPTRLTPSVSLCFTKSSSGDVLAHPLTSRHTTSQS
ncbi:hypothetical protein C8Q78DRAFT_995303 [Trametes maxima]|nr:hypothetical protein C8Q78DRAFT_995303 [Trametes maxima]